jgi:hypothetical protein
MTSTPSLSTDECNVDGGCRHLRELSNLERLIGCDPTVNFYEKIAHRCARGDCLARQWPPSKAALSLPPLAGRLPPRARPRAADAPVAPAHGRSADVIPFVRSDVADVLSDGEGNFVERRLLKPGMLEATEPLGYLRDYWCWLRRMGPCRLANVDLTHVMRSGIVGKLHVTDVESSDPRDFRFEIYAYSMPFQGCERPAALPTAIYADTVLRDYNTVRLTAAPRLQRVRARLGTMAVHYLRLILPLFGESGEVCRLLVAFRQEPGDGVMLYPEC